MNDLPEQDRAALVALLDQALRDAGRTEPPPGAEPGEWLYGDSELSRPDENGWMTSVPTEPRWVPRALLFWRMTALAGGPVDDEHMRGSRHSLARWPAIDEAMRRAFGTVGA